MCQAVGSDCHFKGVFVFPGSDNRLTIFCLNIDEYVREVLISIGRSFFPISTIRSISLPVLSLKK